MDIKELYLYETPLWKNLAASTIIGLSSLGVSSETYTVQQGDNLSKIANKYNIDWKEIQKANKIKDPSIIKPGDKLIIPIEKTKNYKIQHSDNLSKIAKKYGIELSSLIKLNKISDPNKIKVGDIIKIPITANATDIKTTEAPGINVTNLRGIDPEFRPKIIKVLRELTALGWQPYAAEGIRTKSQQAEKVKKGYSKTMFSAHRFGYAVDIVDKRYHWNKEASDLNFKFWKDLGRISKKHGLVWGGDWKSFPDVAHVEYPNWRNIIRDKYRKD